MFNFLFEGKLGELLAPNSASPLFSAIQKNDLDAIHNLIASYNTVDLCRIDECGYSAVHVACRYNNQVALQLMFARGVHVEQPDKYGSTPLHYASKYGHLELCHQLIERGAQAGKRNSYNQTPYDLADSHLIRQYLLPLQFSAERQATEQMYGEAVQPVYGGHLAPTAPMGSYYPQSDFGMGMSASPSSLTVGTPVQYSAPPSSASHFAHTPVFSSSGQPSSTPSSNIVADGFGSSASDPALQAKYGHTKEVFNIAPPPIMGASPAQYSAFSGVPASSYSRYVPYDANAPINNYPYSPVHQQSMVGPPSAQQIFAPHIHHGPQGVQVASTGVPIPPPTPASPRHAARNTSSPVVQPGVPANISKAPTSALGPPLTIVRGISFDPAETGVDVDVVSSSSSSVL